MMNVIYKYLTQFTIKMNANVKSEQKIFIVTNWLLIHECFFFFLLYILRTHLFYFIKNSIVPTVFFYQVIKTNIIHIVGDINVSRGYFYTTMTRYIFNNIIFINAFRLKNNYLPNKSISLLNFILDILWT